VSQKPDLDSEEKKDCRVVQKVVAGKKVLNTFLVQFEGTNFY
jgi:hypothetical protein